MIHIKRYKEVNGVVEIGFEEIGHLLYHEIILNVLKDDLKCEVLSYKDLITDIDSKLLWNGIEFEFNHHYILGNIICTVPKHVDALEQLAGQAADIINEKIKQASK